MTFEEQRDVAVAYLAAKGLKRPAYAPTWVTLLWRLGVRVPPPHFASFFVVLLVTGALFAAVWGITMWVSWWSRAGLGPLLTLGYSALAGLIVGTIAASYYRRSARAHGIPRWDHFHPSRLSTPN